MKTKKQIEFFRNFLHDTAEAVALNPREFGISENDLPSFIATKKVQVATLDWVLSNEDIIYENTDKRAD